MICPALPPLSRLTAKDAWLRWAAGAPAIAARMKYPEWKSPGDCWLSRSRSFVDGRFPRNFATVGLELAEAGDELARRARARAQAGLRAARRRS